MRVSNVGQSPMSNGESTVGRSLAFSYQNGNRAAQGQGQGRPYVGYGRVPEGNGLSPVTQSVMQPVRRAGFPVTNSVIRVL